MSNKTLWQGRFDKGMLDQVLEFTSSLNLDKRLAWYDVVGSIAHVKMLSKQGILSDKECKAIVDCLRRMLEKINLGEFNPHHSFEDIHSYIEFEIVKELGDTGKKVHTARSRNDQVVTDFRMFVRDAALELMTLICDLEKTLLALARKHTKTVMPGFTHLQHAQPITLGHHLLAHFARFERDFMRFAKSYERINVSPLGAAAMAGTTFEIDRFFTTRLLGFRYPSKNSIDAVSDRDFVADFIFNCSMTMIHLSSLCEELIIWSTPEFGFIEFEDAYSTGSSIMPQKKNPDIAELVRARSARVMGNLNTILGVIKSLPLAYNRDLQEDKPALFDAYDTTKSCLRMLAESLSSINVNVGKMRKSAEQGYLNATDLADYLVLKGIPFREAHELVGKIVKYAIENNKKLEELDILEMKRFSDKIDDDVASFLSIDACIDRRKTYGGTSPEAVKNQIAECTLLLKRQRNFISYEKARLKKIWQRLLS
ncbi:MAG: argininosuccinate lyase [Methanomassiliicoccales archaeon]